jgi:hypothetical protein
MNETERSRLGALLRAGDPAAGDPAPAADEAARLRRIVLAATESSPARAWQGSALRWAAAGLVAMALALGWLALVDPGGPQRTEPTAAAVDRSARRPSTAALPRRPALDEPPTPTAPAERPSTGIAGRQPAPTMATPRAAPSTLPREEQQAGQAEGGASPEEALAVAAVGTAAEKPSLQLRVTAPGGTRIVWVLTPAAGP